MITCPNEVTVRQLRTISTKYETRRTSVSSLLCRVLSCCKAEIYPVTMVFPLHTVTDSPGTDIPLAHVLDIFLLCNNLKPYKATSLQKSFLFHT